MGAITVLQICMVSYGIGYDFKKSGTGLEKETVTRIQLDEVTLLIEVTHFVALR